MVVPWVDPWAPGALPQCVPSSPPPPYDPPPPSASRSAGCKQGWIKEYTIKIFIFFYNKYLNSIYILHGL